MELDNQMNFRLLEGEELREIQRVIFCTESGGAYVDSDKILLHMEHFNILNELFNFKWRQGDVFVTGFMKSGTNWLAEILWTMLHNPSLDKPINNVPKIYRYPFPTFNSLHPSTSEMNNNAQLNKQLRLFAPTLTSAPFTYSEYVESLRSPRILKSAFNLTFFDPKILDTTKVIYIIRNPLDVCISLFYFYKVSAWAQFPGTLEEFVELFTTNRVIYGNIFHHFKSILPYKNHGNFHLVYYEDLHGNILEELKKLEAFLETNLTEDQFQNVISHTSFNEMKIKNHLFFEQDYYALKEMRNYGGFFRKGHVGDHKGELSPLLISRLKKFCRDSTEGLHLPYDFSEE